MEASARRVLEKKGKELCSRTAEVSCIRLFGGPKVTIPEQDFTAWAALPVMLNTLCRWEQPMKIRTSPMKRHGTWPLLSIHNHDHIKFSHKIGPISRRRHLTIPMGPMLTSFLKSNTSTVLSAPS